ncbi:uncharacterized protein LOC130510926 [Raphanus sativus]|uniref:Uncharacterized protein LOC130510926 n=1 Tax=Raphanus sativus TaxID=3726 RepID=A0A9W3DI90_RAPSA|nr:uncharacterized protein LOC130510926 [Raphanus sativus]
MSVGPLIKLGYLDSFFPISLFLSSLPLRGSSSSSIDFRRIPPFVSSNSLPNHAEKNDSEPVDDLALMKRAYTNKKTGQIDDGVVRDVVTLIGTQVEEEASQLQTEDDDSTGSTYLPRVRINEIVESGVPKKKGRLFGLGRRSRSVPSSAAPPPFVDPEVLLGQMKDKDDRISALESTVASQHAGWEAQKKLNEQMLEMMRRLHPNEVLPTMPDPNVQSP